MTPPTQPTQLSFLALGRLCVDFAVTGGRGWRRRFELLRGPADLADWLAWCTLDIPDVRVDADDLAAAEQLREAIWWCIQDLLGKQQPSPRRLRVINAAAAVPTLVPQLDTQTGRVGWRRPTARAALSDIARDALDLLGDADQRARVRECANPQCALVFYDDSRPGRRRWCRPQRCGDIMRARAYRRRRNPTLA
jgi:predicted RNA-binding Zn ribbon-like protein